MSPKSKPFCVFCLKKSDPLNEFSKTFLEKCKIIFDIRKKNKLSMKETNIPMEVNKVQKYHSICFKKFSALPKKHRLSAPSDEPR